MLQVLHIRILRIYVVHHILYFSFALILVSLKVEFPEARILEETLNVLLYERHSDHDGDPSVLRHLGSLVAAAPASCSDEDEDHPREYRLRKT